MQSTDFPTYLLYHTLLPLSIKNRNKNGDICRIYLLYIFTKMFSKNSKKLFIFAKKYAIIVLRRGMLRNREKGAFAFWRKRSAKESRTCENYENIGFRKTDERS